MGDGGMGRVESIRYGHPKAVWEGGSAVLVLRYWMGGRASMHKGSRPLLSGLVIYVAGSNEVRVVMHACFSMMKIFSIVE